MGSIVYYLGTLTARVHGRFEGDYENTSTFQVHGPVLVAIQHEVGALQRQKGYLVAIVEHHEIEQLGGWLGRWLVAGSGAYCKAHLADIEWQMKE